MEGLSEYFVFFKPLLELEKRVEILLVDNYLLAVSMICCFNFQEVSPRI